MYPFTSQDHRVVLRAFRDNGCAESVVDSPRVATSVNPWWLAVAEVRVGQLKGQTAGFVMFGRVWPP